MTEEQRNARLLARTLAEEVAARTAALRAQLLSTGDALAALERGAPVAAEVVVALLRSDSESTRLRAAQLVLAYHLGTPRTQDPHGAATATVEQDVSDEELTSRLEALNPRQQQSG